jgi:hypothetical protein
VQAFNVIKQELVAKWNIMVQETAKFARIEYIRIEITNIGIEIYQEGQHDGFTIARIGSSGSQ